MNVKIESIMKHPIIQMCWVVDNMEAAAKRWVETMGAGPFFLMPHIQFDEVTYRGKPSTLDQSSAVGQWGHLQIELFEQHCNSPAGMRDVFKPGQLQHMTWVVDDLDAESRRLEALGFENVCSCRPRKGWRIRWFDARSLLGTLIEVYEENAGMRRLYHAVAQAAENWKGERSIRSLHELTLR